VLNPDGFTDVELGLGGAGLPKGIALDQPQGSKRVADFPQNPVEGNDDLRPSFPDEDDDPYKERKTSPLGRGLDHAVGELSSVDSPGSGLPANLGVAGNHWLDGTLFHEFARLALNSCNPNKRTFLYWVS